MPSASFLPYELKEWVVIVGTVGTTIGVLFASWRGIAEWKLSTKQRQEALEQRELEFRHKQAVYAREITKEVFNDPKARAALEMLDWLRKRFKTEEGEILDIRRSQIRIAMRVPSKTPSQGSSALKFSTEEAFIRTRFEALYDHLEEIEKLIKLKIVNFEDLETVFRYYLVRVQRPKFEHRAFLDYYDYPNAIAFLKRFPMETRLGRQTPEPADWLSPSELEDDGSAPPERA
jgi:hypothetical protein